MNFANAMAREGSVKRTENGAHAYDTAAQGALLDLFAQIGSLRPRTEQEIRNKFAAAFRENNLLATKMLFYSGDIRQGGLGERRTFRVCLRWLAETHPEIVNNNMELIPYFNRFDSWFELVGTKCEKAMWSAVATALAEDMHAYNASTARKIVPVSLLAKWMPSENTSSVKTRQMASKAQRALKLTPRKYRKMLSALRKHINVVERQMSAGEWGLIDYSKVPSYAMHNYGSAFAKHDYERFNAYLQSVKKGTAKIHSSVMYPYDLVAKYMKDGYNYSYTRVGDGYMANQADEVVEAQWNALPNYVTKEMNAIVMADVSGSMRMYTPRPMATSIGLAIYFAQHNKGAYHNKYMTFSTKPHFININEGASLYENVKKVMGTEVGYGTNLEGAFQYILDTAIENRVPKNEMPECLIVVSDMEIDRYMRPNYRWDFIQTMKAKFARAGYTAPKIILWNVEARKDTFLTHSEDVLYVSGQAASTFKELCNNLKGVTAYELMLKVLNGPAYSKVRV